MRLLSREELEMAKFAPKDGTYNDRLPFLAVWEDRVEVTNGHYAIVYRDKTHPPADDFPAIEGVGTETPFKWPVLIPRELALAALKALPRKSHIPILGYAALRVTDMARIYVTDLESWKTIAVPAHGNGYPDISKVMPNGDPSLLGVENGLSADYLRVIADAANVICDNGRSIPVALQTHGDSPSIWTAESMGDARSLTIALMPMRLK